MGSGLGGVDGGWALMRVERLVLEVQALLELRKEHLGVFARPLFVFINS